MEKLFSDIERIVGFACNAVGLVGGILGLCAWMKSHQHGRVVVVETMHGVYKRHVLVRAVVKNETRHAVSVKRAGLHLEYADGRSVERVSLAEDQTVRGGASAEFLATVKADEDVAGGLVSARPFAVVGRGRRIVGDPVDLEDVRAALDHEVGNPFLEGMERLARMDVNAVDGLSRML